MDSPLTKIGIEQVAQNAALLKYELSSLTVSENIRFYSSPLGRAKQSSEIIKKKLNNKKIEIIYDKNLQEVDIGTWNGKSLKEVGAGQSNIHNFNWYFHAPSGENYGEVVQRCQKWVETVKNVKENTIVVMSHGLFGRVLRGYLLGLDYEEATHLDVPQKGFFKIQEKKISFITDDYEAF